MRRLVYAPKVWIFIRSSNLDGVIFDVSDDVVRGSVTQNLNDVSKANFELRNRYHKWIRDRQNGFRSIFLPMDLVTIWMQRIAGRPVQVFTGYLDSVPYYQAYPGNAIFEATCTLKKLAFNWFDPGLKTFMNWFDDNSEWTWDPISGGALISEVDVRGVRESNDTSQPFKGKTITDSGLGKLIGQFMIDVAGWDPGDVIIDKLDPRIPKKAAELYAQIESGIEVNLKELSELLKQFLSVNGSTGHPHRPREAKTADWRDNGRTSYFSENEQGDTVVDNAVLQVVEAISAAASQANLAPELMVFAAIVMTDLDPEYEQGIGSSINWGFGLYAMRPNQGTANNPGAVDPSREDDLGELYIDKVPVLEIFDPGVATRILANRLNSARVQGEWVAKAKAGDVEAMILWLAKAIGRGAPTNISYATAWDLARVLVSQEKSMDPAKQVTPSPSIDPRNMSLSEPSIKNRMTPMEQSIAERYYQNSKQELIVPTLLRAKSLSSKLRLGAIPGLKENQIFITGPPRELQSFYDNIASNGTYESVRANIGGKERAVVNGQPSQIPDNDPTGRITDFDGSPIEGVVAAIVDSITTAVNAVEEAVGTTLYDRQVNTPGGPKWLNSQLRASTGEGGASFQQLSAFSANAAFAANFAFPTDMIMSSALTGQKALMNDISCLDAVKQFTQASLRTFRSLPDGRFLAFYPDYFSARRKPYWKIEDIEIIDFGIQLNDDALATHVYVVGDHFYGANDSAVTYLNPVVSRGVATITHAGIIDTMINWGHQGSGPGHRLKSGWAFLKHFGARPHKVGGEGGTPFIRNSMYEFLLAWQQFMMLWAQQFATQCKFTFMPEVMAGGVIEFGLPHGIQMFCNSVTHNFDYSAGFTTEAEMVAPALAESATARDHRNFPGMALAGGINTVGVGL